MLDAAQPLLAAHRRLPSRRLFTVLMPLLRRLKGLRDGLWIRSLEEAERAQAKEQQLQVVAA